MSFLNILFLAGMAGVAGPVLAHLLARPRFRRIPFTMMQFLEAGQMESHRRRRFRNLFILLLRCAIIACIVLGFAGPVSEDTVEASGEGAAFVAGIDDSLSMAYGDRFATACARVRAEIESLPADTRVDVIGLASGARRQGVPPAEALAFVDTLEPVPALARLDLFAGALNGLGDGVEQATALLASDFTPQFMKLLDAIPEPVTVSRRLVVAAPPEDRIDNLTITDVRTTALAANRIQVAVSVRNQDSESRTLAVRVTADGLESKSGSLTIAPGRAGSASLTLETPDGDDRGLAITAAIAPDDGLAADDAYYVGVSFPDTTEEHVLVIGDSAREAFLVQTAIDVLGAELPHTAYTTQLMTYPGLNASSLQAADTVILTSVDPSLTGIVTALEDFVRQGGQLITFVHREHDGPALQTLYDAGILPALPSKLQQKGVTLASGPALSAGSGASAVRALTNYRFGQFVFDAWYACEMAPDTEAQWPFETGDALVYRRRAGAGTGILINTSADDSLSGMTKSPAALPFFAYLLGTGGTLQRAAYPAGTPIRHAFTWPDAQAVPDSMPVRLKAPSGALVDGRYGQGTLRIPAMGELGHATVLLEPPAYVGLNIPQGETDLMPAPGPAVDRAVARLLVERERAATGDAGSSESPRQTQYGTWALAAALGLLLFETFVANRLVR